MVVIVFVPFNSFFNSFFAHDVLFMGKEVCEFLCNWVFELYFCGCFLFGNFVSHCCFLSFVFYWVFDCYCS